ncbi:protein of unknown function [Nitrospira japonica]|uniref:Uncharacterized protein n=1 Tax=Nitrospira japonica TaxID=1325564 RepID=A0A1W1I4T5_9BACT|nr:hypothetical protein [Nitrospira japonica]SLM47833.1 protein of unknown function [Nitrospira japonica]
MFTRLKKVLLLGLIVMLGVQLTGFTCLDEWEIGSTPDLVRIADLSPSPDESFSDDGCPCHIVFQSASLSTPEIMAPLADDVIVSATLYVPTFIVVLFHPPLSV